MNDASTRVQNRPDPRRHIWVMPWTDSKGHLRCGKCTKDVAANAPNCRWCGIRLKWEH